MSRVLLPALGLAFSMTIPAALAASNDIDIPSDKTPGGSMAISCEEGDVYKFVSFLPVKKGQIAAQNEIPMYSCETKTHYTYTCTHAFQAWAVAQGFEGNRYEKSSWEYVEAMKVNCPAEYNANVVQAWIVVHDKL